MLIPHNPSQHLRRSGQASNERNAELDDVHITVVPSTVETEEQPAARAVPSGRVARMNPSMPPG